MNISNHVSFIRLYRDKVRIVKISPSCRNFSGRLEWENIIHHTNELLDEQSNVHLLYVIGRHGKSDNHWKHCVSINLIHEIMFDSAESNGPALKLNVRALQDNILAYPETIIGFHLMGEALTQCICEGNKIYKSN